MKGLEAVWYIEGKSVETVEVLVISDPIAPVSYDHSMDIETIEYRLQDEIHVVVMPMHKENATPQTVPVNHLRMSSECKTDVLGQEMGMFEYKGEA